MRFATFNVLHGRTLRGGRPVSVPGGDAGLPLAEAVASLDADVVVLSAAESVAPGSGRGWRDLARVPTYPSHRPLVRFDHVLAAGIPRSAAVGVRTPRTPVSDHRPVVVDLSI